MRRYSRLAKVEEKKNIRSAITYVVLTIVLLLFVLYFGLPTTAKLAGFLSDLRGSSLPVEQKDTTPPAPPVFEAPDEFAAKAIITIKGRAEPGVKVSIFLNNKLKEELVADAEGEFSTNMPILAGENTLYGVAKDESGNESAQSRLYTIIYDKKAPDLEITEPADGSSFYGQNQKEITIKGKTESGAQVWINERFATVDSEGLFEFRATLQEGQNNFEVKATDKAGNSVTKNLSVTFSP